MPEYETKTLTCPCCELGFETQLVVGYQVGEKDADFCPRYTDGNPLPQFLHVCPGCGFVGFEADYRNLKDAARIRKVIDLLAGLHWQEGQTLGGAERYRRAALIATYCGKRSAEVADLYLQATWCSRMEGEPDDDQKQARRKAVKYFELALSANEFSPDDMPVVHYLLGELHRRLGDAAKARTHFDKLDEFKDVDKWLIEWRDKQRAQITD
ncbi:MAG: DUF2225 domain-containing protein [Planctomycetes bacterium]|nr:DUF2225 domain-containing protein [Planctomycetota bacterium]